MQFSTILARVKALTLVTSQDALIKDSIQMGLDRATMKDLPYLMTEGFITTVAPYETGTVDVTNGSATVTGNSTVWTAAMVGRKIRIGGENAYYRIKTFSSATSIILEVPYQGTTKTLALGTNPTYSIYKDEYKLPADLDYYKVMRQIENSVAMVGLEATAFDIYEPTPTSEGSPDFNILVGTKLDTYSTGTLSGLISTSVLTGSGTSWTSVEGLSKGSKITIGSSVYTVKSVDSDTQLTIYEVFSAAITAGTTYSILLNNYIIQLFNIPNAVENIYFRYQRIPAILINDQDIPDLPDKYHYVLVTAGMIWAWMTKDKDEATKQEALFNSQIAEMWKRIGYISQNLTFPRRSQDDIGMNRRKYSTDYNIPIPFSR